MTQSTFSWNHAPTVAEGDVDRLIDALRNKGWLTARQLRDFGTDRQLRAWASASQGRIISGQKGYALVEAVTVEEANHAASWLEHQAAVMAKRAAEIRRAMHRRWAA